MNRLIHSLLMLVFGASSIDSLEVGESSPLPDGRFDKGHKHFRVQLIATREA